MDRQTHAECRTGRLQVVGAQNLPFMLAHDSVADAQPQPRALSNFLRGEKWIENALRLLDAFTVIAQQDFHPAAVMHGLNFNQTGPARGLHGVISIVQDVQENLLQLVRVANEFRQALVKLLHDLDSVVGKIISAQRDGLAQDAIDLDRLALRRPLPGKAQKVLHNFFGALRFFQNHLQIFARTSRDLRVLHQQVGKSHDGRQRVVHLMRNAGDKLAHRGHLLCMHQLGLDHGGVGNVCHQHDYAVYVGAIVAHGTEVDGKLALRAIAARDHQLQVVRLHAVQTRFKCLGENLLVGRRDDSIQAVSHQFVLLKSSGLITALVRIADQAGGVRHHDHSLGVVQDLAGKVALTLELCLEVLDLGDIQEYAAILEDFSLAVSDHESVFQGVDHGAVTAAEGHFKVSHYAFVMQLPRNLVALLGGDVNLRLQVQLEDFLAGLVAQHAHQSIVDLNEMTLRRSKKNTFLDVVKQLAITLLGLATVGDVLEHMHCLHAFIQSAVNAGTGNQVSPLQHWMQIFIRLIFAAAKRAELRRIRSNGTQSAHAQTNQLGWTHAYKLGQRAIDPQHLILLVMDHDVIGDRIKNLRPLPAGLGNPGKQP